jgi:hypothetical protein
MKVTKAFHSNSFLPGTPIDRKVSNYYSRNQKRTLVVIYWVLKNQPNQNRRLTIRIFRNVVKTVKMVIFGAVAFVTLVLVSLGVVKKYADAPPSESKRAPYLIETSSRICLGEKLTSVGTTPELTNYWYSQGSKYFFVKGSIDFPPNQYGAVQVISRFGQ